MNEEPKDDFSLSERDRQRVIELFFEHGSTTAPRRAYPTGGDEVVFVLSPEAAASVREGDLSQALTLLLRRKVWIATEPWRGRTVPL